MATQYYAIHPVGLAKVGFNEKFNIRVVAQKCIESTFPSTYLFYCLLFTFKYTLQLFLITSV